MTKRFTSLPHQERAALIDAREARFRERLACELEAVGPAQKLPASPRPTRKGHARSRAVQTPAGVFDSLSQAGRAFGISRSCAWRLACERRRGWSYVDAGS
jgi:hypothetical protein